MRALLQAIRLEYTIIIAGNDFGGQKALQKYSINPVVRTLALMPAYFRVDLRVSEISREMFATVL